MKRGSVNQSVLSRWGESSVMANALVEPLAALNPNASRPVMTGFCLCPPQEQGDGLERVVGREVHDGESDRRGRLHDDPEQGGVERRAPTGTQMAPVRRRDEDQEKKADDPEDDDADHDPGVDGMSLQGFDECFGDGHELS